MISVTFCTTSCTCYYSSPGFLLMCIFLFYFSFLYLSLLCHHLLLFLKEGTKQMSLLYFQERYEVSRCKLSGRGCDIISYMWRLSTSRHYHIFVSLYNHLLRQFKFVLLFSFSSFFFLFFFLFFFIFFYSSSYST